MFRAMTEQACSRCGKSLAAADVLYAPDASVICGECSAKAEIVRDEGRAAGNLRKAAWSSLGSGVLAFFGPIAMVGVITYFFIAGAIVSAIFALTGVSSGNERFTKYLTSSQRTMIWVCCMTAFVLCAI
jgi:hypothetical protein